MLKADSMGIVWLDCIMQPTLDMVSPMEGQRRGSTLDRTEHSLELGHIRLETDSEKEEEQWMCSTPTQ